MKNIYTNKNRWPSSKFKNHIKKFDGDYIINCIGAIHQRTNQFNINWELPQWLDENANCKIIHPGTDCEMDDDDYGNSKRIAAEWIKSSSKNTKIIKTSILGPELNTKASLMEWFLSQTGASKWLFRMLLEWKYYFNCGLNFAYLFNG